MNEPENSPTPRPVRRVLPHDTPHWVRPDAVFFLTVNCLWRDLNQLAWPGIAAGIFESVAFRQARRDWYVFVCLLMPDHLHMLASFAPEVSAKRVMSNWKENVAKRLGVSWQRDYFDHRLRSDESHEEKYNYIRENPVRKGYVRQPDEWPYVWHPAN